MTRLPIPLLILAVYSPTEGIVMLVGGGGIKAVEKEGANEATKKREALTAMVLKIELIDGIDGMDKKHCC